MEKMKSKKILVIGASESCCGIIRTIKQMGHEAIVIGNKEDLPAQKIADYYFVLEDNDVNGAVEICQKLNAEAIVPTPVDRTLHWIGKVAEKMGFIFLSMEQVDNFRNKYKMKRYFQHANILCAKGILTNKQELNHDLLSQFTYPLIIKPLDGFASRGVTKVENYAEIEYYLEETSQFSSDKSILIEEFIDGREFNAEGVCYNGTVDVFAIVEKVRDPFPRTVEMGHIVPPNIDEIESKIIIDTVSAAVKALGMQNGCFNAEIKLHNGKGCIIEVNGRLAGDFIISHLLEPTTGQDMNKAVVNISLGIPPEKAKRQYIKHGMISFFNLQSGKKIIKIRAFDFLNQNPNIIWAHLFFREGDVIPEVHHMGHRSGFVIVTGKNRNETFKLAEFAKNVITNSIEFEQL